MQVGPDSYDNAYKSFIQCVYLSMERGLVSWVETTRDICLSLYTMQPERNKIRKCYTDYQRAEEAKWNNTHTAILEKKKTECKRVFAALKKTDVGVYKLTKIRALYAAEKECIHEELVARYGQNQFFGLVPLREWRLVQAQDSHCQTPQTSQEPPAKFERVFCQNRWLQVQLNRSMLSARDQEDQRTKVLNDQAEDFDLFRYTNYDCNPSRVKLPFQIFAQEAISHYQEQTTKQFREKCSHLSTPELFTTPSTSTLGDSILLSALIQCYLNIQKLRIGPISEFFDLFSQDLQSSRVDSGRVPIPEDALQRLTKYRGQITPIVLECFSKIRCNTLGQVLLPKGITQKQSDFIKHTNTFFREMKTIHEHLQRLSGLLNSKCKPLEQDADFAISREKILKDCFTTSLMLTDEFLKIHTDQILQRFFPLREALKNRHSINNNESLLPNSSLILKLVGNGFIECTTLLKNILYSHLEKKPLSERKNIINFFMKEQRTKEEALNFSYQQQLQELRRAKTQELTQQCVSDSTALCIFAGSFRPPVRESQSRVFLLSNSSSALASSKTTTADPSRLAEILPAKMNKADSTRQKLLQYALFEKEDQLIFEEQKMPYTNSRNKHPEIYGILYLKIDETNFVSDRWMKAFLNKISIDSKKQENIVCQIKTASDVTLVVENFAHEGSHSDLGKFASLVFSYIEDQAKIYRCSPTSGDIKQYEVILMDSFLQALAALHHLRQDLLSLKQNLTPNSNTNRTIDTHCIVSFNDAGQDLSVMQASLLQSLKITNTKESASMNLELISIVNTLVSGICAQISLLKNSLNQFQDTLLQYIEVKYSKDEISAAKEKISQSSSRAIAMPSTKTNLQNMLTKAISSITIRNRNSLTGQPPLSDKTISGRENPVYMVLFSEDVVRSEQENFCKEQRMQVLVDSYCCLEALKPVFSLLDHITSLYIK